MMPELTGSALATEVRRIRPQIPIVIMSGYVDAGVGALARAAGAGEVLRKPLQSREIAEALARVLHASSPSKAAVVD
jgi:CheY-like chemotaxis protein